MSLPKTTRPFLIGVAAGAILLGGLSLGNGWVVSAKANNVEVKDAWINAQAAVCAAHASAHLKETKNKASLEGYTFDVREARDELAKTYAIALPGEETPESIVVSACSQMLNKAL